jgi:hypothetical protein
MLGWSSHPQRVVTHPIAWEDCAMACPAFDVTVKDVKATLAKVKAAVSKAGGSFSGDDTKGTITINGVVKIPIPFVDDVTYTIKTTYTVEDKTITIINDIKTNSPDRVNCDVIQKQIKDWMK